MVHLTKRGMEETEFIVPPLSIQQEFAAFVQQVDKPRFAWVGLILVVAQRVDE